MKEIIKPKESALCNTPHHVVAYIKQHADQISRTLGENIDLGAIMDAISRHELHGNDGAILQNILKNKQDIVTTLVFAAQGE
jgi:hypothetical protein